MQGHLVRYSLASDVKSFCMFFATGQRTVLTCSTFAVELSIWQILARPNEILTGFVFCMWPWYLHVMKHLGRIAETTNTPAIRLYISFSLLRGSMLHKGRFSVKNWKKKLLKLSTFYWRLVFTRNTDTRETKKDLRFAHLDKFSLNFSSASFVICVTLLLT